MAKGFHDSNTNQGLKNSWQTPPEIVSYWERRVGKFTLDTASDHFNKIVNNAYTIEDDALKQDWQKAAKGGIAWCNPPYDNILPWVNKAAEEAEKGLTTVMLIAGTHETKYIKRSLETAERVFFITGGRIGYVNPATGEKKSGGRAPSFVIVFTPYANGKQAQVEFLDRDEMYKEPQNHISADEQNHKQGKAA